MRALAVVAVVCAGLPAQAFVRSQDKVTEVCLFWTHREIPWSLNSDGSDNVPIDSLEAAMKRSFDAWQTVGCSEVRFKFEGRSARSDIGYEKDRTDNVNIMVWRERTCTAAVDPSDPCFSTRSCNDTHKCWQHSSGVIALTTTNYSRTTGVIVDADIEFNGSADVNGSQFVFSGTEAESPTCQRPGDSDCVSTDVQNTATHEIGHLLGLDHSPVPAATMFASAPLGETKKRSLDTDDEEALCSLYPSGGPPLTCVGSGRVVFEPTAAQVGCLSTAPVTPLGVLLLVGIARVRRRFSI